jgi:hypothetical protein
MESRRAARIVTVVVWEDSDSWALDVVHEDLDPWSVLGLLREAYLRVRDFCEENREILGDEDEND